MSDLHNPLFDDEKEFLERQKQEYKNALLGDVAVIKDQSAQVGKGVLIAGSVLTGVWLVSKVLSGKKKKKKKKARQKMLAQQAHVRHRNAVSAGADGRPDDEINYGSALDFNIPSEEADGANYNTPAKYFNPEVPPALPVGNYSMHTHYHGINDKAANHESGSFFKSDFAKSIGTQLMAFALIYLSKKAEEFLLKNTDIATFIKPDTRDVDFVTYETEAGEQHI